MKRLLAWALSMGSGLVITSLSLVLLHTMKSKVTLASYGYGYFVITAVLVGAAVLVWIDHVMKTGVIPE